LKEADGPLTAEEVWTALGERMFGQNRKSPSRRTVDRWLIRWKNEGMLEARRRPSQGVKGGRPDVVYTLSSAGEGVAAAETSSGEPGGLPAVPVAADVARAVLEDLGAPPAPQEVAPSSGDEFVPRAVSYSDDDIPEECR
jgi:hypothetical protein